MRDPKRIPVFCNKLAELWGKVPDWRFGQLMSNVLGEYCAKNGDIFFAEDGEMLQFMENFFKNEEK